MSPLPFDPENPPEDPPVGVRQPMLWRLAVRLHRDHDVAGGAPAGPPHCRTCAAPWPCAGRRTAERGLLAAFRQPPGPRGPGWFVPRGSGR